MKHAHDLAAQALAITTQDWTRLGFSDDPQVAPNSSIPIIAERMVALLAIRSVAVLSTNKVFGDFSTTTISRTILLNENAWPNALNEQVIGELRTYVTRIVELYHDAPYHNREHAYHVTLSANKLLDLMINPELSDNGHERQSRDKAGMVNGDTTPKSSTRRRKKSVPKTFGLQRDTLLQFTLIFAAIIHDVAHDGIANRQLAMEDDPLALLFNDSSILEQQSLTIAFTEFLQPEFANLRKTLFPTREIYLGFRQTVVNLVLATDISNPERMQITKDKWKTAFGDMEQNDDRNRRQSNITEITLPRQNLHGKESRRRSVGSVFSEITVEMSIQLAVSSGDDVSLSDSEENEVADFADATPASSVGGFDTASSDGRSGNHFPSQALDSSGPGSLQKIEELDRNELMKSDHKVDGKANGEDEVTSDDLGYSTANYSKQNGNNSPNSEGVITPKHSSMFTGSRHMMSSRRGSTTNIPDRLGGSRGGGYRRRRASVSAGDPILKRMQQRLSASSWHAGGDNFNTKKYRQRLGIMRSLDLGGQTIENFSRKSSVCSELPLRPLDEYDEPDELRATVVLETVLLCCDVAHNLQGWDHMLKWSHKLYSELHRANEANRGFDPTPGWVQGQTGFLQGYVMPLAKKLDGVGIFSSGMESYFANIVKQIVEQWEVQGEQVSAVLMSSKDLDLSKHSWAYYKN